MERAVTSIDFPKESIQPKAKIAHYERLLKQDIDEIFGSQELVHSVCPTSGDAEIAHSFTKLGMTFNESKNLGNYYISPRPNIEAWNKFYAKSRARHFWLTDIWENTKDQREKTVIAPLFDWIEDRVGEVFTTKPLVAVDFLPNHFGYGDMAKRRFPDMGYKIFNPLISSKILACSQFSKNIEKEINKESYEIVFLFEAIERSLDPCEVFQTAIDGLKPGGLCFITCLLSSSFEAKILGQQSDIFLPPERMNILSFEGMMHLVAKEERVELIEFSTPSVFDIKNVREQMGDNDDFVSYMLGRRGDSEMIQSLLEFLQRNRLGTFGRLVLRKKPVRI
jgi:hypothetical protein